MDKVAENLRTDQIPFVTITLVHIVGSSPQDVGARALVTSEGLYAGTVGGGKVELKAIAHAKSLLSSSATHDFQQWNLKTDVGMTCGGVVSFFFEVYRPQDSWNIAVFGAGHVAQELVRTLLPLNCQVFCIDPRKDWLDKLPDHPRLKKWHRDPMADVMDQLPDRTYIASVTMGHAFDLPILTKALQTDRFPYVGAIGSHSKSLVLKRDLKAQGLPDEAISRLYCPIGEDFGSNAPAEIAISIAAQLLRRRDANQKPPPPDTTK